MTGQTEHGIPDLNMWQHWGSRSTLGVSPTWPNSAKDVCADPSPNGGQDECSREKEHPGRHMAAYGPPHYGICSAWPGVHAPTKTDLTEAER